MNAPDRERTMRLGDYDYFGFTFWGDDLPTGVHIDAGTVAVSPASGLTLAGGGSYSILGTDSVYVWATAAQAGEYDVTFTVNFSDSKALKRVYRITVI